MLELENKKLTKTKHMCNQTVPSVSLQTAVLTQVTEFAKSNQPFSVHDITDALRQKVNDGDLEIPEVEEQGASFRFNIRHSAVRSAFRDMLNTGVFDPQFGLQETFPNGKFFIYVPTIGSVTSATQQSSMTAASSSPPPVAQTVNNVISITNAGRIKLYLNNCVVKNFRPTLRKVQSAIKRNDFIPIPSCEELKDYIEDVLGYSIVNDPDGISRAQVVTV